MEGAERRGYAGSTGGGRERKGRAAMRVLPWLHHPILHREPEDQMPDQSIVHQADIYSAGHDGIYLPRVHINKIKKDIIQNWLSPNNLPTHTIKPASGHHHHLFFGSLFCSVCLSPIPWLFLGGLFQFFYCAWLMCNREGLQGFRGTATYRPLWQCSARKKSSCNTDQPPTNTHTYTLMIL